MVAFGELCILYNVIGCAYDDTRVTLVQRRLALERALNPFGTSGRKRTQERILTNSFFFLSLSSSTRSFVHN